MADIFEVIIQQHRNVHGLLKQLVTSTESHTVRWLRDEIRSSVEVYVQLEESLLFPMLKEAEATRDLVADCLQDHRWLDALLERWQLLEIGSAEADGLMEELRRFFHDHVRLEENSLFPMARRVVSPAACLQLGQKALQMRDQQLSVYRQPG